MPRSGREEEVTLTALVGAHRAGGEVLLELAVPVKVLEGEAVQAPRDEEAIHRFEAEAAVIVEDSWREGEVALSEEETWVEVEGKASKVGVDMVKAQVLVAEGLHQGPLFMPQIPLRRLIHGSIL
jgi:hypothetical protein